MRIYIAGKMTGIYEFNFPAFYKAETELEKAGHFTINPARHDEENGLDVTGMSGHETPPNFDLKKTLLWDLKQVANADAIYLLDGWETSKGANAELALAKALGKEILYEFQPLAEWEKELLGAVGSEVRTTSSTGGQKGVKDERFDLIPAGALTTLARHYGIGARKYDDNQWRKGYEWSKSYAALQRHLNLWAGGQDIDEETGSPHLAAGAWHCFTLLTFADEHPNFDDRFKNV